MPASSPNARPPPTLMQAFRQATAHHQPGSTTPSPDKSTASILESVKEQEAQFELLTRELEAERRSVANQLEKCRFSCEEATMYGVASSSEPSSPAYAQWRPQQEHDEGQLSGSHLVDSCMRVLQDKPSEMPQYHPYSVGYYSGDVQERDPSGGGGGGGTYPAYHPAPTNGHPVDRENPSPNSSMHSADGGHPQLISRTTARHSTQQVKTVTKVIREREVRHIGPDGQPINYPYGGVVPPPPADYVPYGYNTLHDPPRSDYGTYDSGRPPSPGAQEPSLHSQEYLPYELRPHSPTSEAGSRHNYDPYATSPHRGSAGYPEYDPYSHAPPQGDYAPYGHQEHPPPPPPAGYPTYSNYAAMGVEPPDRMPTPPSPGSVGSESPPPQRAMPQAPPGMEYNHHPPPYQPSGYDELDAAILPRPPPPPPEHADHFRGTPSPGAGSDRFGQLAEGGEEVLPKIWDDTGPSSYLDSQPTFADQSPPGPHPYGNAPRAVFDEEDSTPLDETPHLITTPIDEFQHPRPRRSPSVDSETREVRWRDPDLPEVIEFLGHPNNVIKANASAYLQHLCYMDDNIKQKTRSLGGIPPLVNLLNHEIPEVHRNACGALRNLSYGRQNDENKRAIKNAGGIPALVRLLRKTPDNEVRELVTGVLWNLSSCEDLKKPIIDDSLTVITNNVIIPHSGWDRNLAPGESHRPMEIYWSTVFRNASGVLRNVSSAGEYSRKKLRECEGLVDALLHLVRAAIGKNDIDNKSVENCVCILRNLSYRCQEVEDPNYDKHVPPAQTRAGAPGKGENLGCFGGSKKKKEGATTDRQKKEVTTAGSSPRPRTEPVQGYELLWQPEVVQPYLALLSDCSNPETLEASAGAIQNLAACYWQPSIDIRAAVRKEKGLPILVELLRMEVDRVVCAVATALRNLALDQRNKELIGKYAMRDLVQKLPSETQQHDAGTSDETIAAVLATLNEVVRKNAEFARSLLEAGGVDRLMFITRQRGRYSSKVVKFASQVLYNLWQHQELREVYKKQGWRESNFVTRTMAARSTSPSNLNSTLNRPISSQGGTKYEDRTLQRSRELNTGRSPESRTYARGEDLPLSDMKYVSEQQPPPPVTATRPPVGGVQVFPPAPGKSPTEPVYAQVNRDKKKNRPYDNHIGSGGGGDGWGYGSGHTQPIMSADSEAGGDSWV